MINKFTISQIPITTSSDVRFNILKRRKLIKYQTTVNNDLVNLAYVINKQLDSVADIFIEDRSNDLVANRVPEEIIPIIFHGKSYIITGDKFLATDVFVDTNQKIPLFFQHILKNFNKLQDTIHDFSIRDSNFSIISNQNTIFDKLNGILYSNLSNSSDTFYYISYTTIDGSGNISSFIELLDSEAIFKLASIDDLTSSGELDTGSKIYLIEELTSNVFEIRFFSSKLYAIKEQAASKIKLVEVPSTDNTNPWFVSVTNGNFFTTFNQQILQFNIPEFDTQLFNPEFPFKFRELEAARQVDTKILRTQKSNIDASKFVDVILRNTDNSIRYAFTTDPSKLGKPFEGSVLFQNGIRSIDRANGLIDISVNILDTDIIQVSYYYIEDQLEIIDINFNPIQNISILGKRIVFYIVPNTNRDKTLFYLILDKNGIIQSGNQTDNTQLANDINTGSFSYTNFIETYTVQSSNISGVITKYFILGSVFVSHSLGPRDSTLFDVRKRGGGLLKNKVKDLVQINPEVMFCTDHGGWDGIPYPGNGAMIVEIPTYLQQQNGGIFSESEIVDIVERHMAFGTYAIIKGYGLDINPTVETYG